jgi:hypothetical protein
LEQQKEQPQMKGFEEKVRAALANNVKRKEFVVYLRSLEPQFESDFVRMVIRAMIEAIIGRNARQVVDLDSLYKETDAALLFLLRDICNIHLQAQYSTKILSRAEMCRFLETTDAELPFTISRWLQRHKLEKFGIIGMYRRPDSKEPTLIDTLILLLTPEGMMLGFNTEDDHLHKVCDMIQLESIEADFTDDRRYHYAAKRYIDESNCQINHTKGVMSFKKFAKPKILR